MTSQLLQNCLLIWSLIGSAQWLLNDGWIIDAYRALLGNWQSFRLYLLLFVCNTIFVEAFRRGRWYPDFLQQPEEIGGQSMLVHIKKSLPIGLAFGIVIAGASTLLSSLAFL